MTKKKNLPTKNKIGSLNISRELFIETIGEIKKQYDHDSECCDALKVIFPEDFHSGYDNHRLNNQILKLLQIAFNDAHEHSWIEYFIYELDFGKKYKKGSATNADGSEINLSDAGKLFDFLIKK